MRKISLIAIAALLSCSAIAQTKPGFHIIGSVRTNDVVVVPTIGYLQTEVGYFSRRAGITASIGSDSKLKSELVFGGKLYATLFTVEKLNFKLGAEAEYLAKAPKIAGKWAFTPDLSVSVPLTNRLDARASVLAFYHREITKHSDIWRVCNPGAAFSLVFRPFGK